MKLCASGCLRGIWLLMHLTACMAGMTGRCSLFGRHHVHTFDGVLYEFPGDCSYLLAGDCQRRSFTLLGDFVGGKRTGVTLFLGDAFELHLSVDGRLSQGETGLSLPYASHAVFAGMELGFYKLWSEEFGFTVTIDNAANMALTLTKHHANLTCGLCGNFNSVPADEYTAQEGFLTEDSYDFANSWAVKGAGQACRRVSTPSQSCNSSKETSEILTSCSVLQTSSVFLQCAHLVSPEVFLSLCQKEVCHCDQADSEDCYCPILLEYARTCHTHGMLLRGWQQESQCFPKCPVGMHYSECTKSCSTTCHNLNIQEVCEEECVDGCICPVGKVLDGTRCVEVSQCSCVHMGRHFPPGSTISQDCNTCVCRHGSWECTNEGCPGECLVVGQSHFKTFDNKFFTFTGLCQYLLARDCAEQHFSVIIENVQCADDQDAVCTRSVTLSLPILEDMTVKLKHGGVVSVNGMDIQTPMHHGRLHIQRSVQSSVLIKVGDGFRLDWDGRGRVLLKLGTQWVGRTCGLCGNYNGNQGDDFLSGSGLVEADPQTFAQSWRINADCKSTHKPEIDPCSINPKRVRFAEEGCSMIMSDVFSPCHYLVNPGPFQRFCRYDVCSCVDGEECLCSALASYSAACAAKGVLLHWRSPSLCEMQCTRGQVYEVCGSLCDRTCRSLSGAEAGCGRERVCEEGCFCPAGKYLSDSGECVTADKCTCLHDGQLYQPNDVYADHDSICYCESGSMRCSSTEMSTSLSDLFYDDDLAPSRDRRSPQCVPPLIRAKCNAGEKGLECARNCRNVDFPCVSQLCIPGCFCPPGTVYHHRECIVPEQCPCYLHNKPYRSGQTVSVDCNTCICENRKWRCTKTFCDGICRTVGEGHYITFDGLKYTFPGLCQYVLVQDMCNGEEGSFRVLVENEACGIAGHRCTKSVSVFYHGGLIVMQNGEVKMKVPVPQSAQVEIVRSGQFYTLLLGKHISLSWDKGTHLLVHISATYKSRVCGLCGNFDGNVNNDFVSSNNQMEVDSFHFGNSWKISPSCADVTQVPAPCGDNIVRMVTVEQSCHVLSGPLFKECNSQVSVEPYLEMCVEAACSCPSVGDCACFCDVIAAYAQACSERGVSVSWRSNELCPMSCEELNPKSLTSREELCQWRYSTCGPACPITCQHPEPLQCSLTCVEGCHAYCPPGQLLDEVAMRCVDPSECQVCIHDGHKISHGNKVIISRHDPSQCKICHCDNNTLACKACDAAAIAAPTLPSPTITSLPMTTMMPEGTCNRAMDLAFLLDASAALSESEFEATKNFILGVIEPFRMGSAHTRATVLLYQSGVKTCDLQVQKWLFKKIVHELHYIGGDAAFLDEAIKYLAYNIYDKNKREHTGRVAVILTASTNPRSMRAYIRMLRREKITTLTVALGPGVNMTQINDITKANPDNRAYVLSSTAELPDRLLEVTDYLCTLGLEPKTTPEKSSTTTTTHPPHPEPTPTKHLSTTTTTTSMSPTKEVTFIIEGSDSVGEANFNKSLLFLEDVITKMAEKEEFIRITVIQYSITVTVEIRGWDLRYKRMLLLQRLRQIRLRGGNKTNTGTALATTFKETATVPPSSRVPTPPQLVFLVTENPPTDTVTRPPSTSTQRYVYPIGVGPKVREFDLFQISSPTRPIMVEDYNHLTKIVHRVVNITHSIVTPHFPTLPPVVQPTLPSLSPTKEVTFIIEGSDSVGEANFNKSLLFLEDVITKMAEREEFIRITVIQYSITVTIEIRGWDLRYKRMLLLQRLRQIRWRGGNKTNTGTALATTFKETASVPPSSRVPTPPQLVFLVTENPPTDTVTRPPSTNTQRYVYPIGVGPKVREFDLFQISSPERPIMVEDYNHLTKIVHRVVNITHSIVTPHFPTLPPVVQPTLSSLPPTVPCKTPVDVLFLLKAGEQFDDMKFFVNAFINTADIGLKATQVSVIQYGDTATMEFTWKEEQSKSHLLSLVNNIPKRRTAAPALGSVLQYAVQAAIRGGRVGVAKAVVMIVTDKSTDQVREAANEALAAGVSVFPIGVGRDYDQNELDIMGHKQDNSLHLKNMDQLRMLLTLDHGYKERICRAGPPGVCVDDSGMERKPGESWMLEDGCHSVLCHPSGAVTMQSHKVSCDKLEPPACRSNMPPVKVQEACSCHWECPCICMGSSTNHVVRFDSLPLRLDAEGLCSYTLLTVSRGVSEGSEVILHNGPCQDSAHYNQVCMKAIEVMHGPHRLLLKDDMMALIGQDELSLPWRYAGLELVRYGGMMLQLKSDHGYILTFTPQSNEFTITLLTSSIRGHTAGLCGACGDESISILSLRNGSSTSDQQAFVSDWTMARDGAVCLPKRKAVCATGASMGCQALRSEVFQPCHAHIPVMVFLTKCEEQACEESDVCKLISAYALMCRQRGVCLEWRSSRLCPLHCPASMEYDACRTGCIEDCENTQALRGDWSVARGNQSSCTDTPTEGCFCTRGTVLHQGACVSPEVCKQCVDHHGHAYKYLQSWVPDDNPCLICMCLDRQHINCTTRPCNDLKAPICGPCEVLKEKRDSKCCPEYECVCDLLSCDVPEAPRCEDGEVMVLKNPGECQPIHECVCKKEDCAPLHPPECGAHRQPRLKKTKCCDVLECLCNCHNSTRTCSPGFITAFKTNDCGCTETSCVPDKVCVVGGVVHPVGSQWDEGCEKCSCSHLQDKDTSLHIAQCSPPLCDHNCPMGSTYTTASGGCCGKCRPTSCVESEGVMRGDTMIGGQLRNVGEQWQSSTDKCVLNQCVRVKDEVFTSSTNISCSVINTPTCPLGSELRCDIHDCCPRCHCAPLDACVLNKTLIGVGEKLMVDACTRCECMLEYGVINKYRLSCKTTPCTSCPMGYIEQKEEGACCGRCVATTCFVSMPDGKQMSLQVNTTRDDGCNQYACGVNNKGDLALEIRTTTCAPFNRQECLEQGGTISQIGTTCCEMCSESACHRTAGTLNYVKVEDCQSEHQIELHYCEGKCRSKSMYSLQSAAVEQECVCCVATETEPFSVPILCTNGTRSHHTVLSVTACDCQFKHCT